MATTVNINLDNKTVFRIMAVAVGFLLLINVIGALMPALTLIILSVFLAIALNPPVSYLTSKLAKGNRKAATAIAYLTVVSVIGLFLWALLPPLLNQTGKFVDQAPDYVDQLKDGDNIVTRFVNRYELDKEVEELGNNFKSALGDSSGTLSTSISKVGTVLVSLLTVLVLTFLMLVEGPVWIKRFWETQPKGVRAHRKKIAMKMYNVITGYVNGQLLVALMASVSSLIVMLIVGIPFALPLAGIVGMFGLIPLVGATLGSLVVVAIALFKSLPAALVLLVFFLIYQQIENNVIQPMVHSRKLDVSPLLVLTSVIIGFSVGGFLGGFIAIPSAACAKILILDYYVRRKQKIARQTNKTQKA